MHRGFGLEGNPLDFMHRLRELDYEVEQLRAALAALQHHLRTTRPVTPPAPRPGKVRLDDEYLRAYS